MYIWKNAVKSSEWTIIYDMCHWLHCSNITITGELRQKHFFRMVFGNVFVLCFCPSVYLSFIILYDFGLFPFPDRMLDDTIHISNLFVTGNSGLSIQWSRKDLENNSLRGPHTLSKHSLRNGDKTPTKSLPLSNPSNTICIVSAVVSMLSNLELFRLSYFVYDLNKSAKNVSFFSVCRYLFPFEAHLCRQCFRHSSSFNVSPKWLGLFCFDEIHSF